MFFILPAGGIPSRLCHELRVASITSGLKQWDECLPIVFVHHSRTNLEFSSRSIA
jgi:hypothetical protein